MVQYTKMHPKNFTTMINSNSFNQLYEDLKPNFLDEVDEREHKKQIVLLFLNTILDMSRVGTNLLTVTSTDIVDHEWWYNMLFFNMKLFSGLSPNDSRLLSREHEDTVINMEIRLNEFFQAYINELLTQEEKSSL